MFKSELTKITAFLIVTCAVLVGGICLCAYKDMTGVPYSEIEAYRKDHPNKSVTYTVTLGDTDAEVKLSHRSRTAQISTLQQVADITDQAEYLQSLTQIDLGSFVCPADKLLAMKEAFPQAEIIFEQTAFLGGTYARDTTSIDLSHITSADIEEAIIGMQTLDALETVILSNDDGVSTLSLDDAAALHAACPHLTYQYTVELFGQKLSTDMERVEYFQVNIGDEGLTEFRKLLPLMHKLTYFKLDWCETTNEAMAQLRDDFAPQGIKVVWRVFWGSMNALTDTYRVWSSYYVSDELAENFKYLTEVKYLDIGHGRVTHVDFLEYMPDLEVCIIAICNNLKDISGLRNCTKLTYLEVFTNEVSDLSPLQNLKNLEYLNISYMKAKDITVLYDLPNLKRVWSTLNNIPADQVEKFRELHPDCETIFQNWGDPTDYTWRFMDKYPGGRILHPRYALLKQQFGYDTWDFSRYPRGYVTEEITYESTGITPPD